MENQFRDMGNRIRFRRNELDLTQEELAEIADVSSGYISGIETGSFTPSLDVFTRICNGLKTTPDYLLLGSIRGHNIPQDIMDNLLLCNEEHIDIIDHLIKYIALKYGNKKTN